jgi:hypothetical protein
MSLETGSESIPETVNDSAVDDGNYSVSDPGYDAGNLEPVDELAELIAENTTKQPSETSDDASETDGVTEETVNTPADDESVDSDTEISDELLDRALALNYTIDQMKEFSDAKALETEINRVESLQKRVKERESSKSKVPETQEDPEPNWEELVEQGHDPDAIAIQKRTWDKAKQTEALARQVIQAEQARAYEAQCNRFDDVLNSMSDEFGTILGTGRRGELLKASPEQARNRQAVFTKMSVLRQSYELAGVDVPPEADLIQEAVHASFYKHATKTAREKLKGDIKKANSQSLSRPNSGGAKPLTGTRLAEQKENEFWKSKGF